MIPNPSNPGPWRQRCLAALLCAATAITNSAHAEDPPSASQAALAEARDALRQGQPQRAVAHATRAIEAAPGDSAGYLLRAVAHEARAAWSDAAADFGRALEMDGPRPGLLFRRGAARFRGGDIEGSLADWDRQIELAPDSKPDHWQRGLALYYAGRFDDGADQFATHQTVNPDDVENAVWHFLCLAKSAGVDAARKALLPIRGDRRVPMMEVYGLFRGEQTADDVLRAAAAGEPAADELRSRLFYAHLYLGLYHEALGDADAALAHMRLAAGEFAQPHYMGDVARVHLKLLAPAAAETPPTPPR